MPLNLPKYLLPLAKVKCKCNPLDVRKPEEVIIAPKLEQLRAEHILRAKVQNKGPQNKPKEHKQALEKPQTQHRAEFDFDTLFDEFNFVWSNNSSPL